MSRYVQGVMLTHANLLSVVAGQLGAINQVGGRYGQTFTQEDVMISYLPLAHIFDRCALVPLQLDAVQRIKWPSLSLSALYTRIG